MFVFWKRVETKAPRVQRAETPTQFLPFLSLFHAVFLKCENIFYHEDKIQKDISSLKVSEYFYGIVETRRPSSLHAY